MFGNILKIYDDHVIIENKSRIIDTNYLNLYVIFSDNEKKVVGEIVNIEVNIIDIILVGLIENDIFNSGLFRKPNLSGGCRVIYKSELELILGNQDLDDMSSFYIGKSLVYDGFNVTSKFNNFFSNHFAVIGNTGSGKSCTVARLLQNIFYRNSSNLPIGAHIALFDVYGEYNKAFLKLNNIEGMGFNNYSTKIDSTEGDIVNIPAYFLSVDDLALLLDVTSANQLPIIEKTLK